MTDNGQIFALILKVTKNLPPRGGKSQRRIERRKLLREAFVEKALSKASPKAEKKESKHQFKMVCYYPEGEVEKKVEKVDRKYDGFTSADKRLLPSVKEIMETTELPFALAAIIGGYLEYAPFGHFRYGNIGSPYSTILYYYESKEGRVYVNGYSKGRYRSCQLKMCFSHESKQIDISHPFGDVPKSDRCPDWAYIDLSHFAVMFDHRVDFYHYGSDRITRVFTIRSKGNYKYSFTLREGKMRVWCVNSLSRTPLCYIKIFPLDCYMCSS